MAKVTSFELQLVSATGTELTKCGDKIIYQKMEFLKRKAIYFHLIGLIDNCVLVNTMQYYQVLKEHNYENAPTCIQPS